MKIQFLKPASPFFYFFISFFLVGFYGCTSDGVVKKIDFKINGESKKMIESSDQVIKDSTEYIYEVYAGSDFLFKGIILEKEGNPALNYTWDFNEDEIYDSQSESGEHNIQNPGLYTAEFCVDEVCVKKYIRVNAIRTALTDKLEKEKRTKELEAAARKKEKEEADENKKIADQEADEKKKAAKKAKEKEDEAKRREREAKIAEEQARKDAENDKDAAAARQRIADAEQKRKKAEEDRKRREDEARKARIAEQKAEEDRKRRERELREKREEEEQARKDVQAAREAEERAKKKEAERIAAAEEKKRQEEAAEKQRLAAAEAERKRVEAENKRLAAEAEQRQKEAADDAEKKKIAEAERKRKEAAALAEKKRQEEAAAEANRLAALKANREQRCNTSSISFTKRGLSGGMQESSFVSCSSVTSSGNTKLTLKPSKGVELKEAVVYFDGTGTIEITITENGSGRESETIPYSVYIRDVDKVNGYKKETIDLSELEFIMCGGKTYTMNIECTGKTKLANISGCGSPKTSSSLKIDYSNQYILFDLKHDSE